MADLSKGSLRVEGDLQRVLHDGHVRRRLARTGLLSVVHEAMGEVFLAVARGSNVELRQHSDGWGSWSLTMDGTRFHIRTRPTPSGPMIQGIFLRDAYQGGRVVAEWRTGRDVRRWFSEREAARQRLPAWVAS